MIHKLLPNIFKFYVIACHYNTGSKTASLNSTTDTNSQREWEFSWFVLAHIVQGKIYISPGKSYHCVCMVKARRNHIKNSIFFYFLQLCSCLNDLEYIRRTLLELPERLNLPQVTCFWYHKRTSNDNFLSELNRSCDWRMAYILLTPWRNIHKTVFFSHRPKALSNRYQ